MPAPDTLYLVRHAIAEERSDEWPDDTKRPLTHQGRARMRQVVAGWRVLKPGVDVVYTSPLVRAVETAEIIVEGLKPRPAQRTMQALAPGASPAKVAEALASHRDASVVAIVGHEPDLGELAAWLLGARMPLPFKKGGICRIDLAGPPAAKSGQLLWFGWPRMLRALD
jgi:phosphohistidine phosphatase